MPRERLRTKLELSTAGVLATLLALSSCSSAGDAEDSRSADESILIPTAEGVIQYPLTLTTPYGETVLEERPERIAIIGGLGELESALELGVSPVTVPWEADAWSWLTPYSAQFDHAVRVDPWADSLAFEAILAADPYLIIALSHGNLEADYDRLAEIAPVLGGDNPEDAEWHSITEAVGEVLDLSETAGDVIDVTEQYVIDAVDAHPQYEGKTVSIVINRGEEVGLEFVNRNDSPAEDLLGTLGFQPHPNAEVFAGFDWGDVSLENLSLVEADGLIVARHGGTDTVDAANSWLESSAIYQSLDVVQRDDVAFIDQDAETGALDIAWAFAYPNPLSIPWTVDELNSAFEGLFEQ